tara:strand:- start:2188 stop:3753 length:1566 start_codon:yes stop_codon:yes gene_type:complete
MLITLIRFAFVSSQGSINNEPSPPIGLAYLAGVCKSQNIEVKGIDSTGEDVNKIFKIAGTALQGNGIDIDEIIDRIDPRTKIFGISTMFSHEWNYNRECIKKIRNNFPEAMIVAGGEHVTALPEYVLRDCKEIDYIVLGEGEETWSEIIDYKKNNKNFENIKGLAYLKDDQFIKTTYRERIKHIDKIPWPDWDVFPIESYLDAAMSFGAGSGRNMPIMASRGCPFECTFCSNPLMYGRKYYLRQIDDLINQIKYYIERYNITGLQFYDLTAIIRKDWVIDFCKALKDNNINLEWSLPSGTRSEALDLEVLKALSGANLKYLVYAPESGSSKSLVEIKKKIKLSKMEQSIRWAVKQNISVRANLIIGFPKEKRLQVYRTLYQQFKFMIMGVEEAPIFLFQPYPGTELFDYLISKKKIIINDEYFDSLNTLSNGELRPPSKTFNQYMGRHELYIYKMIGLVLSYSTSYISRPKRIFRTIRSVFIDKSSSVAEQRFKDNLRRSTLFTNYIKPFVVKVFLKEQKK